MEIWEARSRGRKKQFEYLLFEKMRLPNLQKARFCSQNCDIHENLGGQGLGTEKINLNIFYLKKCIGPTCKKLDFAAKIAKFLEIWEVRSQGRKKKQFEYLLSEKMRLPNLQKARFCTQNCEIHGNLGGRETGTKTHANKTRKFMENFGGQEPGTKKNMNIFYLKKCACPTSKKLDFADKIVKFMEVWEVRSRGRNKQCEYLLFEKMRLPKLQIARFCSQNCDIHENLGGQGLGTEKSI